MGVAGSVRTHTYLQTVYETFGRYDDAINETEKRVALQGMKPEEIATGKRMLTDALRAGGPKGYWSKLLEFAMQDMKKGEDVLHFNSHAFTQRSGNATRLSSGLKKLLRIRRPTSRI